MGRSITPKYKIVLDDGSALLDMCWNSKQYGKPTNENLEKWVLAYGASLNPNGVNSHVRDSKGCIPYPRKAWIKYNKSNGATVAEWKAPMFMVW